MSGPPPTLSPILTSVNPTNPVDPIIFSFFPPFEVNLDLLPIYVMNGIIWNLTAALLVISMVAGFGLMEASLITMRNAVNVMAKMMALVGITALGFFSSGFAFALSPDGLGFLGFRQFFLHGTDGHLLASAFYSMTTVLVGVCICSAAVAGRMRFAAFCRMVAFVAGFALPVCMHWTNVREGFLYRLGACDNIGAGHVHIFSASFGLAAMYLLRPRKGVFTDGGVYVPLRSSPEDTLFGAMVVLWGWFAYAGGAVKDFTHGYDTLAANATINVLTACIGGVLVGVPFAWLYNGRHNLDIFDAVTSLIASLVTMTAGGMVIDSAACVLIGAIGAVLAIITAPLVVKLGLDDPCRVIAMHLVPGVWSLLAAGLFSTGSDLLGLGSGLFFGGGATVLGANALTALCAIGWGVGTAVLFMALHVLLIGPVRIADDDELVGADSTEHSLVRINHSTAAFNSLSVARASWIGQRVYNAPETATIHTDDLAAVQIEREGVLADLSEIPAWRRHLTNLVEAMVLSGHADDHNAGQVMPGGIPEPVKSSTYAADRGSTVPRSVSACYSPSTVDIKLGVDTPSRRPTNLSVASASRRRFTIHSAHAAS